MAGPRPDSLADVLERVLDRGVVIAGDIVVNVLDIELLTLKVRLLVASADTAREMGIDWWVHDPFLNTGARRRQDEVSRDENAELRRRVQTLESMLEDRLGLAAEHGQTEPTAPSRDKGGDS